MRHTKWLPEYAEEINKLAEEHIEVISAIYNDAFHDGMQVGARHALIGVSIGAAGIIGLRIAGIIYRDCKE